MKRKSRAGPTRARRAAAYTVNAITTARYASKVKPALLRVAARAALAHQGAPSPAELSIVVAGDAYLRRLNKQFRGMDAPTDVLSFPSEDGMKPSRHQALPRYLGDIAISYPRAWAQAAAAGHPVTHELRLLAVHGVLHLLGHDHARPVERARMWQAQAAILEELNQ